MNAANFKQDTPSDLSERVPTIHIRKRMAQGLTMRLSPSVLAAAKP
jgi:hypothetical protein